MPQLSSVKFVETVEFVKYVSHSITWLKVEELKLVSQNLKDVLHSSIKQVVKPIQTRPQTVEIVVMPSLIVMFARLKLSAFSVLMDLL
jgi:uncharacterized protein YbcV (DUF1398 family)